MRCARSTVMPKYSLRSSRETLDSSTPQTPGELALRQSTGDAQGECGGRRKLQPAQAAVQDAGPEAGHEPDGAE